LPNGQFKVVLEAPLTITATDTVASITIALNERIGAWIKEYPEQWLWLHNRWRFL
jgi:Kdo2-lipid IVA lauroyltransferase/acyltransferase